ncbi:Aspartic peptidase [Parasponia andersonii]|uniref:Aspartic peptidase n=1 Tax=Parasponia andersonii TaxID=3476 RepID=A0A2P5DKW7_PARAD|nr:Aspartic peptidase [Parasponia andersonii]
MALRTIFNISITCGILLAPKLIMIFMLSVLTTMAIEIHGLSIKLIPITSLFPKNFTLEERHHKLFEISRNRAYQHVQRQQQHSMIMSNSTSALTSTNSISKFANAVTPPLSVRYHPPNGFYMTQVSIGSKLYSPYLLIDSGTDMSWVQCEGCTSCFSVTGTGNYKYSESQSYRKLPCNHPLCVSKTCTGDGLYCIYNHVYLSSSGSGVVSTETFTFRTESRFRSTAKYPDLVFGCAFDNRNIPFAEDPGNVIAGVFGLDLGRQSMLVQLQAQTKLRFSYCLSWSDRSTVLQFGDEASASMRHQKSGLQTTTLERGGLDQYYVAILSISIPMAQNKSRCVQTNSATLDFRGALVEYIAQRYSGLRPMQRGIREFDLCYNLTTPGIRYVFPSMTFHFKQADFVMRLEAVFQSFGTVRCLAMLAMHEANEPTILGAFQQTNYRFLFDGDQSLMSFVPENCA